MKKILFFVGLSALALGGCSQTEELESGSVKTTRLTLIGDTNPETRTSIGELTDSKYPVLWSAGDALGLFSSTEGADIANVEASITNESDNKHSGTFVVSDPMTLAEGGTDLMLYYPYQQGTKFEEGTTQIASTLAAEQAQSAPDNSRHIGRYGFAYASTRAEDDVTPVKFTLHHAMAYVKFEISTSELSTYKLQSVSLYAKASQTSLSGKYTVDIADGTLACTGGTPYATVTVAAPELLSAQQTVWLTTLPADLTGEEVYVVVQLVNDQQATVTLPILREGHQLKANSVNTIRIDNLKLSDNSCAWYEPVETRLLVGGWAYGESNCVMSGTSTAGVNTVISVKARGNFMEVDEPKFAGTILHCDLDDSKDMTRVNGSGTEISAVSSDYTITINAVASNYPGGCGAVAIYGEDGQTPLWSFSVWMTSTPAVHAYRNGSVMDRNIGAYEVVDNWKSNGVYFQWGRPMPFGWGAKGYYSAATEATDVRFSVENPRRLLYTAGVANTKSDWYLGAWTGARTDRKDDFWGNPNNTGDYTNSESGRKSIYDPCPKGYRIVSPAILKEVEESGVFDARSSVYALKYCYDGTNYAYWPLAGCRWGSNPSDRAANNSKTCACYWSSSPATTYSNDKDQGGLCLYYQYNSKSFTYTAGRSHAFSVRCMVDSENR